MSNPHASAASAATSAAGGRAEKLQDAFARVRVDKGEPRPTLLPRKRAKRDRHSRKRVAFMHYSYYDVAFKYFVEQVLDADYVAVPAPTRRTLEVGTEHSNDFVCAPFKHILGSYVEALEAGANVLVQFTGYCRLTYYGELQEMILRDMGYDDFEMLNFSMAVPGSVKGYVQYCKKVVNPELSVARGAANMVVLLRMVECLDAYNDYYLANAGFEVEHGSFSRARASFFDAMRGAVTMADVNEAYRVGMDALRALPTNKPADPIRVGIVGEYFTAVDPASNLELEKKLLSMGVEVHRALNITNYNIRYSEKNTRKSISEYVKYDMGPTSTFTVATAKRYMAEGFDGVVHAKSSGCTPEIDCMPPLQRLSRDYHVPMLFLSYDSQTSDTGLDTRLEAFYDMISMKKAR